VSLQRNIVIFKTFLFKQSQFLSKKHLAISGDIFGCHNQGVGGGGNNAVGM
jgi:hypothetical protein